MSKYYTVLRESQNYGGTETIKTLWGVLFYVLKTYRHQHKKLASKYTLTIKEHSHYENLERKEYKRLHKKWGES